MKTIILLGGNGYLGRSVTAEWLKRDPEATFYIISRSGKNELTDPRIKNLKADVSDYASVKRVLPEQVDYLIDFIGRPEKDSVKSEQLNRQPALVMKRIAEEKKAKKMGFIGGLLGPKTFLNEKKTIIQELKTSPVKLVTVEPTLLYGAGRNDGLAKMVPIFKVLGIFSSTMRPMLVTEVASELVDKFLN